MSDSLKIRCLVCEEPFDQLEESRPGEPVGGVSVVFDDRTLGFASVRGQRQLRAYVCDDCIFVKGQHGLIHLVRTTLTRDYQTWKPPL